MDFHRKEVWKDCKSSRIFLLHYNGLYRDVHESTCELTLNVFGMDVKIY